jgi:site-specific DNA-methyltransferase (adenine-specific)
LSTADWTLTDGDCRELLTLLPDNSIDAIVTDPPYEMNFMAKSWDRAGIATDPHVWNESWRVLKPGGYVLAFGGTRTFHRLACAIEDAGFEIRDCLMWLYGTGFPKSLNVGNGIGTALKPAWEPIIMARKPFKGTVKGNVAEWGTGGLNIDASRIEGRERTEYGLATATRTHKNTYGTPTASADFDSSLGRWPANLLLDEDSARLLDEQTGIMQSPSSYVRATDSRNVNAYGAGIGEKAGTLSQNFGDTGGASRFFYIAKASRSERDRGCDELPLSTGGQATDRVDDSDGLNSPRAGAGRTGGARCTHPTIKPIKLMRWLVKLVTPPGGTVLDPFVGSGTTGIAANLEGYSFIGFDQDPTYIAFATARIAHWAAT